MKETAMLLIVCMVPICLFSLAAFLIYKQVDGWGWFLLCVVIITGNISYNSGGENNTTQEVEQKQ